MTDPGVVVFGIPIPSTSKVFLTVVGVHVLVGVSCVVGGFIAMLSTKGSGRHVVAGAVYYWCLTVVFASTIILSIMRWPYDNHLLTLGGLSFGSAATGRAASRYQWRRWPQVHIVGMGASYVLLLTAFYVDNGPNLPLWRELPAITYWVGPGLVGLPIIVYALRFHPLAGRAQLK
jgi:hypothetical protein